MRSCEMLGHVLEFKLLKSLPTSASYDRYQFRSQDYNLGMDTVNGSQRALFTSSPWDIPKPRQLVCHRVLTMSEEARQYLTDAQSSQDIALVGIVGNEPNIV